MVTKKNQFILFVVIFCLIAACSADKEIERESQLTSAAEAVSAQKPQPYRIQPGDSLEIKFFYNPELNEIVTVRPDGKISLQLIDDIKAINLQPAELDRTLTKMYSKELRKPVLTVIVRTFASQRVFVGGEVVRPGLISLAPGMDPVQAVFQAGGILETAQLQETILIRKGDNNEPIPIRLDLTAAMTGNGPEAHFQLQPNDIVYIPKSPIAKANLWVSQYIQQLLLFNGWSFGFGYNVRDNVRINF
jgi:protein involved in polysaccharide export with SLBB domain